MSIFNRLPFTTIALVFCAMMVTGCAAAIQNTNYRVTGLEDHEEMYSYLDNILQERVAGNPEYGKETDSFEQVTTARKQDIVNDLTKALYAKGYYDATVDYINNIEQPLVGEYRINSGALYTVESLKITPKTSAGNFDFSIIKEGDPLEALPVLQAQKALYDAEQKDKCYFSLNVTHSVLLNEKTKTATLEYSVDAGSMATFGSVLFEGHESIKDNYLSKMIPWQEDDCFSQEKIQSLETKLLGSGLFVRAVSKLPETPDSQGHVPVTINLKERTHRSIKAGANYYTDQGIGAILGWEHRNLLGEGEKFQTELNLSQMSQSLGSDFTKPFFLRNDQSLEIANAIRRRDTDAFEEIAFDMSTALKRRINRHVTARIGGRLSVKEITDDSGREIYGLLSIPANVTFDNRDNTLDPHRGWLANVGINPFYDTFGESDPFTKFEAGTRTYLTLGESPDVVLALRANAGTLYGSQINNIPATERFYAGGGGSVRGFGYQQVGPFKSGDPTGGRSMVTSSAELRTKWTDSIGIVTFIDAGNISKDYVPDLGNLSIGAGIGLRYYTDFGPLRFDVAVPLNHKDNLDRNYQLYISIGQAF